MPFPLGSENVLWTVETAGVDCAETNVGGLFSESPEVWQPDSAIQSENSAPSLSTESHCGRAGIIDETKLAHTWCVDEQAPLGGLDEIATRGRVAALFVATCRTRVLNLVAEQTVQDG